MNNKNMLWPEEVPNNIKGKCALVAGGAGFIGSHLCDRLLLSGYKQVVCMDNLQTGNINNIKNLLGLERFSFIKHDIVHPFAFESHLDEIYNFACPASPKQYQKIPIHTFKTSQFLISILNTKPCPTNS